ncbi:DNA-directed RNA polymerase III subunit RPC10 isoform X1 [Corythoichthys intestinalis]|uniref:DNA-directed RNA polymerase III subunit RPC10 isoform X1 n=1 Tax=Corythoichthys intestinalis TaxID=161448 RepID=UPI0025A5CB4D|nr:DNA-directed RNA polymerase III subunit RPC10 isoform X1 [Corythoichthys intestinalis]
MSQHKHGSLISDGTENKTVLTEKLLTSRVTFSDLTWTSPGNLLASQVNYRKYPKLKEVDDVLGGAAAWENVDSTAETCPKCEHPRAYFMQIQTRSADEPMTTFYKCCNAQCGHRWRD